MNFCFDTICYVTLIDIDIDNNVDIVKDWKNEKKRQSTKKVLKSYSKISTFFVRICFCAYCIRCSIISNYCSITC